LIDNKKELKRVVDYEKKLYFGEGNKRSHMMRLRYTKEKIYFLWKYVYYLRHCELYKNTMDSSTLSKMMLVIYRRKKNRLGEKLGIEIAENCFEEGLQIYHGMIVVNSMARIGKNCKLHGMNCIGNNGYSDKVPMMGMNVELGVGAVVIGDITISDGTVVAANAVVNRSVDKRNCVMAGVPAKVIKERE